MNEPWIYYGRDDHTGLFLPMNVEEALTALREERDSGGASGMLMGRPQGLMPPPIHCGATEDWPRFLSAAKEWIEEAVAVKVPPPLEEQIAALRSFAQDVMRSWPEGDVDGGDLQEYAEKHGLIVPRIMYAPCDDEGFCECANAYIDA